MTRRLLLGLIAGIAISAIGCDSTMPTGSKGGGGSTSPATIKAVHKEQKPG